MNIDPGVLSLFEGDDGEFCSDREDEIEEDVFMNDDNDVDVSYSSRLSHLREPPTPSSNNFMAHSDLSGVEVRNVVNKIQRSIRPPVLLGATSL